MTKKMVVAAVAMVVVVAMVMSFVGDFGHNAGVVIETWKNQVEVQATRTPVPLTTVIYNGKEGK